MAARQQDRQWPWMAMAVLALAASIVGLWFWWLTHGARLAHAQAITGTAEAQGAAASAPSLEQLAHVGDLFGGINALFAALAFAGVLWAASLQRRALLDARAAFEMERRAIARQQFESTFFQLLALLREVGHESQSQPVSTAMLAAAELADETPTFRHLANLLFASIRTARSSTPDDELLRELIGCYETEVHATHSSSLGRYFRALHQILDLIDSQTPDSLGAQDKVRYANIVRGQIPECLLLLLAVNGLRQRGRKTRRLIACYGLLKYLHADHADRLGPALHRAYGKSAFAGHEERQTLAGARFDDDEWWLTPCEEERHHAKEHP